MSIPVAVSSQYGAKRPEKPLRNVRTNHKWSSPTYGNKVDSSSVIDLNSKLANLVGLVNQVEVVTSPANNQLQALNRGKATYHLMEEPATAMDPSRAY